MNYPFEPDFPFKKDSLGLATPTYKVPLQLNVIKKIVAFSKHSFFTQAKIKLSKELLVQLSTKLSVYFRIYE